MTRHLYLFVTPHQTLLVHCTPATAARTSAETGVPHRRTTPAEARQVLAARRPTR